MKEIVLYTGGRVLQGPFSGMQYFAASADYTDCAMLLGLYERELIPVFRKVTSGAWGRFIEIGCAQGYYAVGVALKAPSSVQILAFDANPNAIIEAKKKAVANDVSERIQWRGVATCEELLALHLSAGDLLFVDIDGGERNLLVGEEIPGLSCCDILVETHDFIDPGITELLRTRFSPTHSLTEFVWSPIQPCEIPFPGATEMHALCVNGRPPQNWLWLQARSGKTL